MHVYSVCLPQESHFCIYLLNTNARQSYISLNFLQRLEYIFFLIEFLLFTVFPKPVIRKCHKTEPKHNISSFSHSLKSLFLAWVLKIHPMLLSLLLVVVVVSKYQNPLSYTCLNPMHAFTITYLTSLSVSVSCPFSSNKISHILF